MSFDSVLSWPKTGASVQPLSRYAYTSRGRAKMRFKARRSASRSAFSSQRRFSFAFSPPFPARSFVPSFRPIRCSSGSGYRAALLHITSFHRRRCNARDPRAFSHERAARALHSSRRLGGFSLPRKHDPGRYHGMELSPSFSCSPFVSTTTFSYRDRLRGQRLAEEKLLVELEQIFLVE